MNVSPRRQNITSTVEFIDLIDHQSHQTEELHVKLRKHGQEHEVPMTGAALRGSYTVIFRFAELNNNPSFEIQLSINQTGLQEQFHGVI